MMKVPGGKLLNSITFAGRVRLAYCVGLLGPKARKDMERVGRIRNCFAHGWKEATFDNEPAANMCRELETVKTLLEHQQLGEQIRANRDRFILAVVFLSQQVLAHGHHQTHAKPAIDLTATSH